MRRALALWAMLLVCAPAAHAADESGSERMDEIERRVGDLERRQQEGEESGEAEDYGPGLAQWARHVRIGGSADVGYFHGQEDSVLDDAEFQVWDARFFVDAELGREIRMGDHTLVRNAGFSFEWDLVRLGDLENRLGDLYAELQGLAGSPWLNLQVGRFQIPVGEAYLRYGKGYANKPFVSNAIGGPWFWDEGVKLYGGDPRGCLGYVASVSDGDTSFNADSDSDKQVTLKLLSDPLPWLHLSVSGARSGGLGNGDSPASGSLWLGEAWTRAFGSRSDVPSFVDGAPVADAPNVVNDTYLAGGDLVLHRPGWGSLWLGSGALWIDSRGGGLYDQTLHYWVAELVVEGALASPLLAPFYAGARANGLGTYDRDQGYLLDSRYADTLGYNMETLTAYTAVLGWKITRWLRIRAEYSHVDIDLVRGVPAAIRRLAQDADSGIVEIGVHF
jgi:hypothetical protein